jgi:hypothetical protein
MVTLVVTVETKGNHAAVQRGDDAPYPPQRARSESKPVEHAESVYLEKLCEELTHRGLEAFVMAPPGRVPSLYVVNPGARALEDNVYAGLCSDGMWWFWWSWAERIGTVDDIDHVATTITRVLALPRRD